MLFPTLTFALFFALVYPVSWLLTGRDRAWRWFMLGASYVFYGYWDWRFVSLIIASTAVNAWAARRMAERDADARRPFLMAAVGFDLALLGAFKYYGFFIGAANEALHGLGLGAPLPLLALVLPVGISFYTFQALSYVVDVYRGQLEPAPTLDVAVYLAFFPQLVAGPIVRASELLPQLDAERRLTRDDAGQAGWLIASGLFKKVVVSSYLATTIVDPVFAVPAAHNAPEVWAAVYGYAVQIYADFSGYTDMAIGIALLLGFRFPQNFDRPYAATSLRDFWRRWHMTLSRWLRDYLYIPLGGNRRGRARTYLNLLLTMTLGGLWHGAASTFVAWGLLHGLWLSAERALLPDGPQTRGGRWIGRFVTFHVVCLGWVLFRAESFGRAVELLARAVPTTDVSPTVASGLVAVIAGALAVQLVPERWTARTVGGFVRLPPAAQGAALGGLVFLSMALGPQGVAPFIYFQF